MVARFARSSPRGSIFVFSCGRAVDERDVALTQAIALLRVIWRRGAQPSVRRFRFSPQPSVPFRSIRWPPLLLPPSRQKLAQEGAEPEPNSPEAFTAFVNADIAKWLELAHKAGIKLAN